MKICEKLKIIRNAVNLSQPKFAELVSIPVSTYRKYEQGQSEMGSIALTQLLSHPACKKYALWFMTSETAPDSNQIAPGDEVSDQQIDTAEISQDEFQQEFVKTVEDSLLMFCHLGWFEVKLKKEDKVDIDTCAQLILKDVTPTLRKMPRQLDNFTMIDKTG